MKKYTLFLIIALLFLLTGCYSDEEKAEMEAWKEEGIKISKTYINDKYGKEFKIDEGATEVLREDPSPIPDFFPDYMDTVQVVGTINDRDVVVIVSDIDSNTICYDDYQALQVYKALEASISKWYGEALYSDLYFSEYSGSSYLGENIEDGMLNTYSTGDLASLMSNEDFYVSISMAMKSDESIINIEEKIGDLDIDNINVCNFKSNFDGSATDYDGLFGYSEDDYFPYLKEIYQNGEYRAIDVRSYDEFLYCSSEGEYVEARFEIITEYPKKFSRNETKYRPVTKAYSLEPGYINVYFAVKDIEGFEPDKEYAMCTYYMDDDGEMQMDITVEEPVNGYIYSLLEEHSGGHWFLAEVIDEE